MKRSGARGKTSVKRSVLLGGVAILALPLGLLVTQAIAHDEGPAHHSPLPANATGVMKKLFADRLPPENLSAITGGSRDACTDGEAGGYDCNNVDLMAFLPLADIGGTRSNSAANDIWGWTDIVTGREFAIVGRVFGTSFVEVTDPLNPVYLGELPTHGSFGSTWRDIKVYGDYAFIVSEALGHGMQVFDLTQLLAVSGAPLTFSETAHYNKIGSAHNIVINEDSGYAYIVGASGKNSCSGGLHMVNIFSPTSPSFAGCFSADGYTHDAQCVNYRGPDADYQNREICFASNEDTLTIVDVSIKSAPSQVARIPYAGSAYTHQGWLTEDQRYFLLDDELDEQDFGHPTRTRVFDLLDLDNLNPDTIIAAVFDHASTAIDHNLYTRLGYAFEANYRSGLRILDVSVPTTPAAVGHFDIFPDSDAPQFNGAWSNYPYFPSGTVVVSGIEQGLFVLRPTLVGWPDQSAPEPPAGEVLHVAKLDGTSAEQRGGRWLATVTITVHDADDNLEDGVRVDGSWTSGGSVSCTTDETGTCSTETNPPKRDTSVTFTVDGLSRGSDTYDSSSNLETSIIIPR